MALDKHEPVGLDALFCEESIENDEFIDDEFALIVSQSYLTNDDENHWDDSELESLLSKEKDTLFGEALDNCLLECRRAATTWIFSVRTHYGFTPLTGVLAVNYFDRFIRTSTFQRDKPWMCQLAAVACLSLAAKVEEPFVPLLVDLQVVESRYIFEAKTIKRMEILVLSSLKWRMHPVTVISFFNHFASRVHLSCRLKFLGLCERILLSFISDSRVSSFLPSVTAAAIMALAAKEIGVGYVSGIFGELNVDARELSRCNELVEELRQVNDGGRKRKNCCALMSPNAVIDGLYSSDSSNDSWSVASSPSSLPCKSRKLQDQLMR